jgi:metal-responsive CopG/Arc/MetJ family transcriptional regulator
MQIQRINITIPKKTLKQLQMSVPEGQRSRFITRAVEDRLKEQKTKKTSLRESLKANYDYYKKEGKVWEATLLDGLSDK